MCECLAYDDGSSHLCEVCTGMLRDGVDSIKCAMGDMQIDYKALYEHEIAKAAIDPIEAKYAAAAVAACEAKADHINESSRIPFDRAAFNAARERAYQTFAAYLRARAAKESR